MSSFYKTFFFNYHNLSCPDPCDAECTLSMKPVCASNDATYFNRCFLTLAACKDPEIEYVKDGHCNASTTKSTQG